MKKINTLVFAGGAIHDWKGCSQEIVKSLSKTDDFEITLIEDDLDALVAPKLDPYDLIVFYYTVGEISDAQKNGLLNHISSGKGYVGVHSAADSFRGCPEYRAMVGGHFTTHPHYREYQVSIVDSEHPITEGLVEFSVTDEEKGKLFRASAFNLDKRFRLSVRPPSRGPSVYQRASSVRRSPRRLFNPA